MLNAPTAQELSIIPPLYYTEQVPIPEKFVYLHFFFNDSHWYAVEYCKIDRIFFGFAIINGDKQNSEWGYFPIDELLEFKSEPLKLQIEKDIFFKPLQVKYIPIINECSSYLWKKKIP